MVSSVLWSPPTWGLVGTTGTVEFGDMRNAMLCMRYASHPISTKMMKFLPAVVGYWIDKRTDYTFG